jgi:Holliday junction DNA helicase RuvA
MLSSAAIGPDALPIGSGAQAEAYGALVALGYKPVEATRLLKSLGRDIAGLSTEELIRRALQNAVRE